MSVEEEWVRGLVGLVGCWALEELASLANPGGQASAGGCPEVGAADERGAGLGEDSS